MEGRNNVEHLSSSASIVQLKKRDKLDKLMKTLIREKQIWLLCLPIIIWVLTFAYYPMYGLVMAFVHYIPGKEILECDWAGHFYFQQFLTI